MAEREGAEEIREGHVKDAEKRIEHDRVAEAVRGLPPHSRLVLCSVYLLARPGSAAPSPETYTRFTVKPVIGRI